MVLSTVTLYRYDLPLTVPLRVGGAPRHERRGLLVRLDVAEGHTGWGDAAPLPGFSTESLAEVVRHARTTVGEWVGTSIPVSAGRLPSPAEALGLEPDEPASFRFAVGSALASLIAQAASASLPALFGNARPAVALNALLPDPLRKGPSTAAELRDEGYQAVKVKVGRGPLAQEIDALRRIRSVLGDDVALRADANRAWSLETAVTFADAARDLGLAYVEEPLADSGQLPVLARQTGLPVALDETTREETDEMLREAPWVSAVVLKPTLLGLRETLAWRQAAAKHGATPVLSGAYESGLGVRMLVALASAGPDVPVGLSTYGRLAADVFRARLPLGGPVVDVSAVLEEGRPIDDDRLTRIEAYSN